MAREAEFLDLSCNKQLKCPNDLQDFKQITSFLKRQVHHLQLLTRHWTMLLENVGPK